MNEDDHIYWQDTLESVLAGRTSGLKCPFCYEGGIDVTKHRSKTFDDLEDDSFDLIISLSPEAQHKAVDMTRTMACDVEFWNTLDPTIVEGSREDRLEAYRSVRDGLMRRIRERFPVTGAPQI